MDHLPKAHRLRTVSSLSVPCLVIQPAQQYPSQPQGPQGFLAFPSRHGYTHETIVARSLSDRDAWVLLQSWLFFGLLREVFARPDYDFHHDDFVNTSSTGEIMISTKALPRYFRYWIAARSHYDPDAMKVQEMAIDECLPVANRVLNSINFKLRGQVKAQGQMLIGDTAEMAVFLSLSLLGDYLSFARGILEKEPTAPPLEWENAYLDEVMKNAGWCGGELSTMRKSCNLSSRYYLSTMNRNVLAKDHRTCVEGRRCQAHQVRFQSYQTKHIPSCTDHTGCTEIGPDIEEVVTAIENGGSALIRAHSDSSEERYRLQVLQTGGINCLTVKPYVAISHVWSDGRGNPRRNCLCRCQLFYIQELVNNLYDPKLHPVPFWMDTLCIPVGQARYQTRRTAIARISQTFSNADKVLVVDSSLLGCSIDASWLETFLHVQYSPWMTRLWTYLEGRIASDLYFQFGQKQIPSTDIEEAVFETGGLVQISRDLQELPKDRLRSSASAIQLIRAMATAVPSQHLIQYAELSPQSDSETEELRQESIRLLEAKRGSHALRETWRPFLEEQGIFYELDDGDDLLRHDLEIRIICPVVEYARDAVASFRAKVSEFYLDRINRTPDMTFVANEEYTADTFRRISVGFTGRTTSWLDDETVCVGSLLGTDVTKLQEIRPMNWRWRKKLDMLDCRTSRYSFFRSFGINFARWTEACHTQRMKLLLYQIRSFPLQIIYWNEPRLELNRWTWAPRSFLNRDFGSTFHRVRGIATLGPHGLEFSARAYRLAAHPRQENTNPGVTSPIYYKIAHTIKRSIHLESLTKRLRRWLKRLKGGSIPRK